MLFRSGGHVQSLILACTLIIMGFLTFMIGLLADVIAAHRKLLQDTQYHARRAEYDALYLQQKMEKEAARTYRVVDREAVENVQEKAVQQEESFLPDAVL